MNPKTARKLEALQGGEWFNPPVAIVPVWNAYNECRAGYKLMMVTWWGNDDRPLAAGFCRFTWDAAKDLPLTDDGRDFYDVVIRGEKQGYEGRLDRDDVVLVFPPDE